MHPYLDACAGMLEKDWPKLAERAQIDALDEQKYKELINRIVKGRSHYERRTEIESNIKKIER